MSLASETNIAARADRLAAALADPGVDMILVTELVNVRYLTGFTGSNGMALIGPDTRVFSTDFRYVEQSAEEVDPSFERVTTNTAVELSDELVSLLPDSQVKLGFDETHTSVSAYDRLKEQLGDRATLVPTGGLVEQLRRTKDATEIEAIARSQKVADAALEALLAGPIVGRTERELALQLEHDMRLRGASGPSFSSIVAAGPHGALPHAQPRDVVVEAGTLMVIDWGAIVNGYCSDCTRTVATGEISGKMREAYELVLAAQLAALEAITAGADCNAVDAVARDMITAAGHGEHFGHGLGHGVGLDVHEAPTLSKRIPAGRSTLEVNDIVTDEPGVYLPGEFGIRIEDLCVVTEGAPRILTSISKELRTVS
jgi:Xaa-Pro aminopeptidase